MTKSTPSCDRPAELLLVLRADHRARRLRLLGVVGPGVADVAGHERAALGGDLVGDPDRLAVHLLEVVAAPDVAQLVAVGVVGQRDHHVRPGAQELAVQLAQRVGLVEDHLGDERAGLDVAAALELEDVALGAEDDAVSETLLQGPRATDGPSVVLPSFEAGRVEAGDVVDGAALRRASSASTRPTHGRELVAGAAPADADERVGEARDRAEHEVVVGDEVVVALVDVLDVA